MRYRITTVSLLAMVLVTVLQISLVSATSIVKWEADSSAWAKEVEGAEGQEQNTVGQVLPASSATIQPANPNASDDTRKKYSVFLPLLSTNPCDHHVYPGVMKVFGNNLNGQVVQPGDRVCVHAGTYAENKLEFLNFVGAPGNPITIVNEGGQVLVKRSIYLTSSRYIVLDGSGTQDVTYGFKILNPSGGPGLGCGQYKTSSGSKGYELSNLEIHHVEIFFDSVNGSVGVYARNDSGSGPLENLSLHDIYIHRTKRYPLENSGTFTEGFYIGSSFYETQNISILRNIMIYNNRVEESGWDGIQVGSATGGCQIFNNTVIKNAREHIHGQTSGIMINSGSSCDIYNNKIIDSQGEGVYYKGIGGNHIYNNLVLLAEQLEIEPMLQEHIDDGRKRVWYEARKGMIIEKAIDEKNYNRKGNLFVYNNTTVGAKRYAIGLTDSTQIGDYKIFNNLIVNSEDGILGAHSSKVFNNYIGKDSDVHFADLVSRDYHLTERSVVAIDKGVWDSNNQAVSDLDGQPRVALPDIGAFEYAASLPTATPTAVPTPSDSLELEAEDMALTFPMVIYDDATASGGKYIQTTQGGGGTASYVFNVAEAGEYKIEAKVMAPDTGTDSFYVAMDQDPQDPQDIWDVLYGGEQNSSWTWDEVAQRGNGTFDKPQYDPRIFNLSVGTHYLYIKGREAGVKLDWLRIVRVAPTNTPTPTPTETLSPTPTPTVTSTPLPTDTPMPTFTSVPSPTNSPTPMNTPSPTATNTPTPLPTDTPIPTTTPTNTPSPTATSTPTPLLTDTPIPTNTAIPSLNTPTPTFTSAPSPTNTPAPRDTPLPTNTPTLASASTPTPTATNTLLPTYTPTPTNTLLPTHTPTLAPTNTPTLAPASTPTPTPTNTPRSTPTLMPTLTDTPRSTPTLIPNTT